MNPQQLDNNVHKQPGFISFLKIWWYSHYFGTKIILIISAIFGFIDIFTHFAFNIFSNSPDQTMPFQIQRLIFAPFIHYYNLDLILAIICINNKFKDFEIKLGTVAFIITITSLGFITQSLCLLLQFIFSYIYNPFYQVPAYSLWNYGIFFIIQECLVLPNGQSQFLIFPLQLKNKYYPLIFVALFTLIQQSLTFISSSLIAILYNILLDIFSLQLATIEKLEKTIIFKWFIERIDFRRVSNYQDQLEPSVDSRELPYVETPPAKLTAEGSAPFPPSLVLSELQQQLSNEIHERVVDQEEQKQKELQNEEQDL
ncbi:unnamed protein product [Paramecium sonneborni]|uniref:Peptidase S54 rhomboid domain-containing protein n=1 Tax=Paramecium sonneborni TaxID=65129 RepID=A0A8S1MYP8_9CILI|nr:unnamed protein product [Paramecium sonneborni]